MTLTLTGTGGLFTRLGKIGHALNVINTARGTTVPDEVVDAVQELDAENDPNLRDAVSGLLPALTSGQSSLGSLATALRTAAERLLVRQVHADNPLPEQTVAAALAELRRQMLAGDHYVDPNTVGATATQTNLDGDGAVVVSTKDVRGRNLETLLAEDLECIVTNIATAGGESIQVLGEQRQGDKLHWLWPDGSGANGRYTAVDAAATANKLTNGDFEDFTTGEADNWTDDVGAWATDWLEEAATIYKGSKGVELVGDGATLAQISQDITAKLSALKQYAFVIWVRRDGSAASAGVLTIDLYDGSGVIDDEAGTANSFTIDLTALTTSFVAYKGSFRIPEPKPAAITLRIRLSTALESGRSVFLDHAALAEMSQPAQQDPGGVPFLSFFSGASNWTRDDYSGGGDGTRVFKVATTNNHASDWQKMFDRLFNISASNYQLPTAGSNLINDSLIG